MNEYHGVMAVLVYCPNIKKEIRVELGGKSYAYGYHNDDDDGVRLKFTCECGERHELDF